uniref:MSP domain-containing protein n=1 Tax=Caenorhabditis tropicalis TaxID=1561998 RepID=A0A1I7U4W9_9PELO
MPPKEAKDNGMADGGGPDLTGKILFDPSVAVQFKPVEMKQVVKIIVTNTSTHNVGFKWKTTAPGNFKIRPPFCHVASNKTQEFSA